MMRKILSKQHVLHDCGQNICMRQASGGSYCAARPDTGRFSLSFAQTFVEMPTGRPLCDSAHQKTRMSCCVKTRQHTCTINCLCSAVLALPDTLYYTQKQSTQAVSAFVLDMSVQHVVLQITLSTSPPGFRAPTLETSHNSGMVPERLLSTHFCTGLR